MEKGARNTRGKHIEGDDVLLLSSREFSSGRGEREQKQGNLVD